MKKQTDANQAKKILVINGPNLDMLGRRGEKYGNVTLDDVEREVSSAAAYCKASAEFFQSNSEGEIIDRLHAAMDDGTNGIVINGGAYSHYSYAIADALEMLEIPVIEVHMTNIYAREEFRAKSVFSPVVDGVIVGLGKESYFLAAVALCKLISQGE